MLHLIQYQSGHALVPALYQLLDVTCGDLKGRFALQTQAECGTEGQGGKNLPVESDYAIHPISKK